MTTGAVQVGTIDIGTVVVGAGSTATLATIDVGTSTTLAITPAILYQRTTHADNGFATRTAVCISDDGQNLGIFTSGGESTVSWGQAQFTFVTTGSSVLVRVANTGGTARYVGTVDVLGVGQFVDI